MPKRALVLSGGGSRGSFQIGVLEHLILNKNIDFEILCGVSAGALNTSFLAQAYYDPNDQDKSLKNLKEKFIELRDLWLRKIQGNASLYNERFGCIVSIALGADSLYDISPLKILLKENLKVNRIADSNRVLKIGYVTLETGKYISASSTHPNLPEYILASASIPFVFPPVEVNGEHLIDGGVRNITPLKEAFDAGAEEIYVVYTSPFNIKHKRLEDNALGTKLNAIDYTKRAVEIIMDKIYFNDVEGAQEFNEIKRWWEMIKYRAKPYGPDVDALDKILQNKRYAKLIEFVPEKEIIENALDFAPEKIEENYSHGIEVALKVIK